MAQALTVTVQGNPFMDGTVDNYQIILDWTSATDGTVSLAIASTYTTAKPFGDFGALPKKIRGYLRSFETIPGASGDKATALPTDAYDITLLDAYGYDVLAGNGSNRSGTLAQRTYSTGEIEIDSDLTLTIAAAGNTTKGRMILFMEPIASYY
jgi:hypothetical protein